MEIIERSFLPLPAKDGTTYLRVGDIEALMAFGEQTTVVTYSGQSYIVNMQSEELLKTIVEMYRAGLGINKKKEVKK